MRFFTLSRPLLGCDPSWVEAVGIIKRRILLVVLLLGFVGAWLPQEARALSFEDGCVYSISMNENGTDYYLAINAEGNGLERVNTLSVRCYWKVTNRSNPPIYTFESIAFRGAFLQHPGTTTTGTLKIGTSTSTNIEFAISTDYLRAGATSGLFLRYSSGAWRFTGSDQSNGTALSQIQAYPITKNTLTIPARNTQEDGITPKQLIIPFFARRGERPSPEPGELIVNGVTGVTAEYKTDSVSVVFTIDDDSPVFTTPGVYTLSNEYFGVLTLTVIDPQTLGAQKFFEDFGTVPETWSTEGDSGTYRGNPNCEEPARYLYYRGPLEGKGKTTYNFQGYQTSPTTCEYVAISSRNEKIVDGNYALLTIPYNGRPDEWRMDSDHTGNENGLMMVVNADMGVAGSFYNRHVEGLCNGSDVRFSFNITNVYSLQSSTYDGPINVQYEIWDKDPGDNVTNANNLQKGETRGEATLLAIDYTGEIYGMHASSMVWREYELFYTMPNQGDVFVILRNRDLGGNGNDLAIDDIKFEVAAPFSGTGFTANIEVVTGNNEIKLAGTLLGSFSSTENYYYRWQSSPKGKNMWSNLDNDPSQLAINSGANSADVTGYYPFSTELLSRDFRLVLAKGKDAFGNEDCVVTFDLFYTEVPFAHITSPTKVCTASDSDEYVDFMLEVTFVGNILNNQWEFQLERAGFGAESVVVTEGSDGSWTATNEATGAIYTVKNEGENKGKLVYIPQRISSNTVYTLVYSKTGAAGDDTNKTVLNQKYTVHFNPDAILSDIKLKGAEKVCVEQEYTYEVISEYPFPAGTTFTWQTEDNKDYFKVLTGEGTSKATIKFSEKLKASADVTITAYSGCRGDSITRSIAIEPTTLGPTISADVKLPTVCSDSTEFSFHLLRIEPVDGATSYRWDWDFENQTDLIEDYSEEYQTEETGIYRNQVWVKIKNNYTDSPELKFNVAAGNRCGLGNQAEVTLQLADKKITAPSFTLSTTETSICQGDTFDLETIDKSVRDGSLQYTYYKDELGTEELKSPAVPAGKFYIKGTNETGCYAIQPFEVKEISLPVVLDNVTIDATCAACPVTITLPSTVANPTSYYLFGNDTETKAGKQFGSNGAVQIENGKAGWNEYLIKLKSNDGCFSSDAEAKAITVQVAPLNASWLGSYTNSYGDGKTWQDQYNWSSAGGHPIWCTDVLIPENKTTYPVLGLSATQDACRDITFEPNTSVAGIHKLHYRKAFVQFRPERNRWYMVTAPLKYMYAADYTFTNMTVNGVNGGWSPRVFTMYFNQKSPDTDSGYLIGDQGAFEIGHFSKPFTKQEEKIPGNQGFALWVNGENYPTAAFPENSVYKFPRFNDDGTDPGNRELGEKSYHYYYAGGVVDREIDETLKRGNTSMIIDDDTWVEMHTTNKRDLSSEEKDNRFRFSFEDLLSSGNTIKLSLPFDKEWLDGSLKMYVVTNPTLSYLDFNAISKENIQGYYRIWNGQTYSTTTADEIWKGLIKDETNLSIAPMQAFFVEPINSGTTSLSIDLDAASTDPKPNYHLLRSSEPPGSDFIRLSLSMNGVETSTVVAVRQNASAGYKSGEDIAKLFSPNLVPEIYTLTDDLVASEINLTSYDALQRIPVGISMMKDEAGKGTLTVGGIENFGAYTQVYLFDALLNKRYDLFREQVIPLIKEKGQNSLNDRFFLEFKERAYSAFDDLSVDDDDIRIIQDEESVTFYSRTSNLERVDVISINGQTIGSHQRIGAASDRINTSGFPKGIYLFKVSTETQTRTFKVSLAH